MSLEFAPVALTLFVAIVYQFWRLRRLTTHIVALRQQCLELQESRNLLLTHAYFDHLTGLANRSLLEDRFRLAVERSKRSQVPFALIMVDLNNFKPINDAHGHMAGDQVLVVIGKRLEKMVRGSDTVARFGGDEFVLIVEALETRQELGSIGSKLIDMLGERIALESGQTVSVGASIGFAVYPADGQDLNSMLNVADKAMYDCKTSGMMSLF